MKSEFFDQNGSEARAGDSEEARELRGADPDEAAGDEQGSEGAAGDPNEEVEALRDRYLRLAAEFDNFRKRTDRERLEGRDRSQAQLVEKLLEPLDDLQRVAQFAPESTTVDALLEGVRMVERKLVRALEGAGLEPLDAHGKRFDPEVHEALMMTPTEKPDEDETVGEVFQSGYRFRGSLLRPARVQVRQHGG
ncbi:MAG: nucleotide exchange factor GrpE [Gemmatimonadota bacterium]